jgi:hypothetical protein
MNYHLDGFNTFQYLFRWTTNGCAINKFSFLAGHDDDIALLSLFVAKELLSRVFGMHSSQLWSLQCGEKNERTSAEHEEQQ